MEQREMLMYGGAASLVIVIIIIVIMTMKNHKKIKTSGDSGTPAAGGTPGTPSTPSTPYTYIEATRYENMMPNESGWNCDGTLVTGWCVVSAADAATHCDSLDMCIGYQINSDTSSRAQLIKSLPDPSGNTHANMKTYLKPLS